MEGKSLLIASSILLGKYFKRKRRQRRKRLVWTREWIKKRQALGAYYQLMKELKELDTSSYKNFLRMDAATFEQLLHMVAPSITHQDTVMREAITPGERLAVTLRFLATGEYSYSS